MSIPTIAFLFVAVSGFAAFGVAACMGAVRDVEEILDAPVACFRIAHVEGPFWRERIDSHAISSALFVHYHERRVLSSWMDARRDLRDAVSCLPGIGIKRAA